MREVTSPRSTSASRGLPLGLPLAPRTWRRVVLACVAPLLLGSSVAACIFDKGGDYEGGGRIDKGASAKPAPVDAGDAG